ncbi:hypothetical protein ABIB75_008085 [Bradyrhizobium sp. GM2.2]|uniref:hypothetical protein n=1 Tax=Bradyrhizobium sp. GM2.2 TaxID=3156358 RepID=UPI00339762A1
MENTIRGDPALEPATIAAARRLVGRGAVAVTSNCGFLIRHQWAVATALDVPVALSSLILLPALLRQLSPAAKIAVLTFDSTRLTEDMLGVVDFADRSRIAIAGVEGGEFWHNSLDRPPRLSGLDVIERDVTASLARIRATHPDIAGIVFECAGFPPVSRRRSVAQRSFRSTISPISPD